MTSEAWGPRDKTHTPPLGALGRCTGGAGAVGTGPKRLVPSDGTREGPAPAAGGKARKRKGPLGLAKIKKDKEGFTANPALGLSPAQNSTSKRHGVYPILRRYMLY